MLHFRWTCNGDGQISFDLSCTGSQCGIFLGTAKTCTTDVNCPTGSICMDIISPLDDPLSKTYTLGLPSSVQSSLALYGYQLPSFPPLSLSPMGWLDFIFPRCSSQKSAWKEDLQAVLSAVLRQTPPQTGTEKYCIANTRASAIMNDQNKVCLNFHLDLNLKPHFLSASGSGSNMKN